MWASTQFRTLRPSGTFTQSKDDAPPTPQRLRVRLGVPTNSRRDGFQSSWRGPSAATTPQDVCFLTLFTFCRLNSGVITRLCPGCCLVSSTRGFW